LLKRTAKVKLLLTGAKVCLSVLIRYFCNQLKGEVIINTAMITQENFEKQLCVPISKRLVLELSNILSVQGFPLSQLINLTFLPKKQTAFRASWILENLLITNQLDYLDDLRYFFSCFRNVHHSSCQRHYAKIAMHLTNSDNSPHVKSALVAIDLNPVAEQCFDWLIDQKVNIAVKCFAAETLFNLRQRYDWINDDLGNQLSFLKRNSSAGLQAKIKKLLDQLVI